MASASLWLRDFLDLFSPRYCAVCGARLNDTERELCGPCLLELPYVACNDFYDNPVARLLWENVPLERAHSLFYYRHDSDSHLLLVRLKYEHRPELGRWAGRFMADTLLPCGFFDGVDAVVAVPLHWRRQWQRGYNQSLMLARGISEATGLPLLRGWVRRIRNNETQTHKMPAERIRNVENLFRSRPGMPCRHVLLVDDVLTTGATLTACARAMVAANPQLRISVLTLARA